MRYSSPLLKNSTWLLSATQSARPTWRTYTPRYGNTRYVDCAHSTALLCRQPPPQTTSRTFAVVVSKSSLIDSSVIATRLWRSPPRKSLKSLIATGPLAQACYALRRYVAGARHGPTSAGSAHRERHHY